MSSPRIALSVAAASFAVAAFGAAPIANAAQGAGASGGGQITVTVTNMRNTKGVVRACMTSNSKRFPRCGDDPNSHKLVVSAAQSSSFTFTDVAPGRYAIALLHDENDNGKADRALFMMPKEGFGFSRDAKVRMGPPKYRDAVFDYAGGTTRQTIRMRYLL
jgi:uncharacterized protein (DUF2141 family)